MPNTLQLMVDIDQRLKQLFKGNEGDILNWLRTTKPELNDLAPVELIAVGKAEHLLAYIISIQPSE